MALELSGADLRAILLQLADVLDPSEPRWAHAMRGFAARLASGSESPGDVARDILGIFAGMGSFSDVVLQDRSGVKPEQSQLDALRSSLFRTARQSLQ